MRSGWALIWALAIAQLVSWGSLYYSFSLFVVPMEAELGWSRTTLDGALSLGLLVAGLLAYPVGAWIDRHGGRAVMSLGSLSGAALLWAWSSTRSPVLFYALWLGLGLSLAATLYEPVFAVITRSFPQSYRLRITALTLVGGFASTVFVPRVPRAGGMVDQSPLSFGGRVEPRVAPWAAHQRATEIECSSSTNLENVTC